MKAIINFATGHYIKGQERLRQSLIDQGFDGEFMGFTHESQIGAPQHNLNPYAFKIYCFKQALTKGYKQILWVDASVWAIKPLDPIFDKIEQEGHVCQEAGHLVGTWANDKCLEYFNITRDEAMKIVMIGNAGFLGLDFNCLRSEQFFNRWSEACKDGIFIGQWNNNKKTESQDIRCNGHRHDMSCSSIIAHQLMMNHVKGDEWLNYAGPDDQVNDTVILKAQGM